MKWSEFCELMGKVPDVWRFVLVSLISLMLTFDFGLFDQKTSATDPTFQSQDTAGRKFLEKEYDEAVKEIELRIEEEHDLFIHKITFVGLVLGVVFLKESRLLDYLFGREKRDVDQNKELTKPVLRQRKSKFEAIAVNCCCWAAVAVAAIIDVRLMFNNVIIVNRGSWLRGVEVLLFNADTPSTEANSHLHVSDISNFSSFAMDLTNANAISMFVKTNLSNETQKQLENYSGSESEAEPLEVELLSSCNSIIDGPSIYNPGRFKGVALRRETLDLIVQSQTTNVHYLNRSLLEDAFPNDITKRVIPGWETYFHSDKAFLWHSYHSVITFADRQLLTSVLFILALLLSFYFEEDENYEHIQLLKLPAVVCLILIALPWLFYRNFLSIHLLLCIVGSALILTWIPNAKNRAASNEADIISI